MLFRNDPIYVRIPKEYGNGRYEWFEVDTRRKLVYDPIGIHYFPYLSNNQDMVAGIDLLDAKLEDEWLVKWNDSSVVFSNLTIQVVVEKAR